MKGDIEQSNITLPLFFLIPTSLNKANSLPRFCPKNVLEQLPLAQKNQLNRPKKFRSLVLKFQSLLSADTNTFFKTQFISLSITFLLAKE